MKSGRRMKKTKNNTKIMKKLAIFIIILCVIYIIINNNENVNLYYKSSANQLQYKNLSYVDLQNPSFEVDSFDDTKGVTYNKSITGWKTPSSDGIIGVRYNPDILNDTQYFFELDESKENSLFYNVQLEENTDYNWSIVHRSRTFKGNSGYCTAAVIIGPEQEVEPSKNSIDLQDQFMKITTWLKENNNMKVEGMTGISEEHVVYTSKFTTNGGFDSESFSLEPTDECTEKWSVWLVKDSVYCFEEYNVQFNSNNISDAVVAISYFDTTLSDKSCGNLIKEFKIYNDNVDVLNMNAEEVYENNKTLLSAIDSKGYATLPSANSASATIKEGIWNSTEVSKKLEIGMYNSNKNVYGLVSPSSINASDGEQFVLGANIYQTITTTADSEMIKISFDGRGTLASDSNKNRLFVINSTNIPSENPDTKKTQFDYLAENSYFKNNCTNNGLAVIYTAKFAENGKFAVDIAEAVSSKEDEIHTEKLYVYTYENSTNSDWKNYNVDILNTSKEFETNLILYFNSSTYEGANNLLDNVQVSFEEFNLFEGEGIEESPFLINNEEDFRNFRKLGMSETNIFYFKQTDNITLTQPLEVGTVVSFHGVYDGDGYYIENLNASSNSSVVTLINYLYGTVKNLGLKDIDYISTNSACAIADYLYGTVENCWVTGNISGGKYGAGIVSGIANQGTLKNSYFVGTVTATNNFGAAGYRVGSTPTFVNVFSTTDECITSIDAPNVTPTITNCATKTEDEMKTQEFLDTLNQYVTANTGLTKWIFDANTGLPVFKQVNITPKINALKAVVDDENSNILWMYDTDTKEYNLYLPKLADRSNLTINVDYSVPEKEASVYDENNIKLGILKSGEANNYFTNDKIILKFDDENTETYTINVLQSTLPSVFLNIDGGDAALNEINADKNHDIGYPGTAVINDSANKTKTATFKKMKGRGNYTWTYSKRPYQVSFDEKISMLGMPKSKKWLFITNYTDGSLTRSAMFYKLTQELGIQYAITFETADVYINGKYNGTYLVTSKVESGSNRVDITDDDYLMEIDNYTDPIQFTTERTNKKITIKSPDVEDATVEEQQAVINAAKAYVDSIESLIYDENVTYEKLSSKIDMESFAKCYWVYEISLNYDAMYGSSYMYTKDGLLHMGPMWDYDNTLNLLTKNAIPLNTYYLLGNTGGAASKRLRWYNELMKRQEFSDLVDKVFLENVDKFDELIEYTKQYNQNITASAKMNYTRWPYATMKQEHPSWYMGGNSFEESSQNLIADIEKRVNFYKNEYKDLTINEIKYETTDVNGQKVANSIKLEETNKIEIPNTVAADAEIKLIGISENNVERDMGTVNLTEGKYQGNVAVSNQINVELDKKSNRGVYSIEIQRADLEIKSIEITSNPDKTEYIEGQKVDTTGMVVMATYSDNTTSEISDYEIDLKDELKTSDEKVIVTYGGKSTEFDITVKENTVTKVEITKQPTKTEYIEGQNFEATGMIVKATYLDGTEKEITDYTIENGNELGKDVTEVEIKFGKFSAFVPVTVSENILVSIEVTTPPIKTEYIEGQTFDKTGMVVTGTLLDGSSVLISGYSVSENKLSTDDTKIEVVFKEKITYVNIVVKKNIVTKIEVTKQPIKTEYIEGQTFDKTGMVVKATYLDGTENTITDYTINNTTLKADDEEIEVEFEGVKTSVKINVTKNKVEKVEITKLPNKTQYSVGEKFDATGMVVKATYLDGTEKEITDYKITKTESLKIGDTTITIEYEGITSNIDITVKEIVYTVLEGENEKFVKNQDKDISVKINADVTLFQKVCIDGEEIDSSNYVVTSGSTIITLKQSYLNKLSIGSHTMKTIFTDGSVAYSTITVMEEDNETNNVDKENTNKENNNNLTSSNPKTGDNIVTFVAMFMVSVLGIAITVKYKKNKVARKH